MWVIESVICAKLTLFKLLLEAGRGRPGYHFRSDIRMKKVTRSSRPASDVPFAFEYKVPPAALQAAFF